MQAGNRVAKVSGKPFPNGFKEDMVTSIGINNPHRPDHKPGQWVCTYSGAYMLKKHLVLIETAANGDFS